VAFGWRAEGNVMIKASNLTVPRLFLVAALLPPAILAILAVLGAREGIDVVMTGSGSRALLGAAWVAVWLASWILSPIAVGAALVSLALQRRRSA
jgi:hypothetical protein